MQTFIKIRKQYSISEKMYLIKFKSNNRKKFKETLFGKIEKRKKFVYYRFGLLGKIKAVLEKDKIYSEYDFTSIPILNNFLTENSVWKITKIKSKIKLENVDSVLQKKINKYKSTGIKIKKGRRFWVEKAVV